MYNPDKPDFDEVGGFHHDTKHPCYGRKCKVFIDNWVDGFFVGVGQVQHTDYVAITLSTEKKVANPKMVLVRMADTRGLDEDEIMGYYHTKEIKEPPPSSAQVEMCPLLNYTCVVKLTAIVIPATIVGFYSTRDGLQPVVLTRDGTHTHASWDTISSLKAPQVAQPTLETKPKLVSACVTK